MPLLSRNMPVPNVGTSKVVVEPPIFNGIDVTVHQTRGITWPSIDRGYKALGWTEHILPDSSVYYSHRDLRVTTEVDLRNSKKLESVAEYLDKKRPTEPALPPPGWELWLRDNSRLQIDFIPVRCWVSHNDRVLTLEPPTAAATEAVTTLTDDEREHSCFSNFCISCSYDIQVLTWNTGTGLTLRSTPLMSLYRLTRILKRLMC
jgi:hypothetical protein